MKNRRKKNVLAAAKRKSLQKRRNLAAADIITMAMTTIADAADITITNIMTTLTTIADAADTTITNMKATMTTIADAADTTITNMKAAKKNADAADIIPKRKNVWSNGKSISSSLPFRPYRLSSATSRC